MVIAISLSLIMGLFSGGLKSKRISEEYSKAIYYSQIKMEPFLLDTNRLSTGIETGNFDDVYSWESEITEIQNDADSDEDTVTTNKLFKQYKILLTIKWKSVNKEKRFVIQTIKLEMDDKTTVDEATIDKAS
jgi:general secretion pathway protein I